MKRFIISEFFIYSIIVLLLFEVPLVYTDNNLSLYQWLSYYDKANSLSKRIDHPEGYSRINVKQDSFAFWLRHLPLKKGNPPVHLYNCELKGRQDVHVAVIDIDVGDRDLQQCADAVIRLRAEYLWSQKKYEELHFNFLSGFNAKYTRWKDGYRPRINDAAVSEIRTATYDDSYECFKNYLFTVFMYANTSSLYLELEAIEDITDISIGDVFICRNPGGVCHAEIVVDVVINDAGNKKFLLAQSYMPAQDIHIIKNPNSNSPWYDVEFGEVLETPEWTFSKSALRRFR